MMVIVEHGFAIALVFVELGAGFEFGRGERGAMIAGKGAKDAIGNARHRCREDTTG